MFSLPVIKGIAQLVGGLGVAKIATQIVRNNTTVMSMTDVILVRAGSFVIGSMAMKAATEHIDESIDDIVENIKERLNKTKEENEDEGEKEIETEDGA